MDAAGRRDTVDRGGLRQHVPGQLRLCVVLLAYRPGGLVLPPAVDGQHAEAGVGEGSSSATKSSLLPV